MGGGGDLTFGARAENNKCGRCAGWLERRWGGGGGVKKSRSAACCSASGPLYRPPGTAQHRRWEITRDRIELDGSSPASTSNTHTRARTHTHSVPHAFILTRFEISGRVRVLRSVTLAELRVRQCPGAVVVVRPCAVQCLVTGRPVWGCNNPSASAHAPDSMLLKGPL